MKQFLLYILLLSSFVGFSQVSAEIDTTNIRIGEQFGYKISVDGTENVIIPKLEKMKGLEVISEDKIDTINNRLIKKYILTGFDSGAYYVPSQQIFIRNQAYLTDSLLVNVATVAVDTTKIKKFPIKGIKGEPYQFDDFKQYLWYVLALLALIGLLLYYFIFRKKKVEEEVEFVPALAPYEEAIQKLNQLDEKLLWQNNKVKQYYSELTEILRNYIGRDIEIPTLELTSNEIVDLVTVQNDSKKLGLSKETISNINKLLRNADLVKFAKSKPISNEIEFDRKTAEQIINNIQPKVKEYKAVLLAENPELAEEKPSFQTENSSVKNQQNPVKKKSKINRTYIIIGIVVLGLGVLGTVGYTFGKKIYNSISKYTDTTTTQTIFNGKWQEKSFGNPAISIESPVDLKKENVPVPAEVKDFVALMETNGYISLVNGLQIVVVNNQYVDGIEANLEGATNGAVAQMQQQPNVSNLEYEIEPYNLDNVQGSKIFGTGIENGVNKNFEAYTFVHKNHMWMVILGYKKDDAFGQKIVERISKSIKIDVANVE